MDKKITGIQGLIVKRVGGGLQLTSLSSTHSHPYPSISAYGRIILISMDTHNPCPVFVVDVATQQANHAMPHQTAMRRINQLADSVAQRDITPIRCVLRKLLYRYAFNDVGISSSANQTRQI
jgi:hypothetical protein